MYRQSSKSLRRQYLVSFGAPELISTGFASWQRYCTPLQWASAKLCGVEQRAPPIFHTAAITLGIGPHSSFCGAIFRHFCGAFPGFEPSKTSHLMYQRRRPHRESGIARPGRRSGVNLLNCVECFALSRRPSLIATRPSSSAAKLPTEISCQISSRRDLMRDLASATSGRQCSGS